MDSGVPEFIKKRNQQLIDIINRTKIDNSYSYQIEELLNIKTREIAAKAQTILDFGKSSRQRFSYFNPDQIETADINQFEDYPDYVCDVCDKNTLPERGFDAIICHAILEHVYDPFAAVANIYNLLEKDGIFFGYTPFIFRYHAPQDLHFQDYYRFSRDGLAYLFKEFADVTLYPVRGRASSSMNLMIASWKDRVESRGAFVNKVVDKVFGGYKDPLQTSGYIIWAVK